MLALWAALVFISVSYARRAPTLEYSEPGALAKPLWAARAFCLETTMVGPVAMRVRRDIPARSSVMLTSAPSCCGACSNSACQVANQVISQCSQSTGVSTT
jgi:hypothetical protein